MPPRRDPTLPHKSHATKARSHSHTQLKCPIGEIPLIKHEEIRPSTIELYMKWVSYWCHMIHEDCYRTHNWELNSTSTAKGYSIWITIAASRQAKNWQIPLCTHSSDNEDERYSQASAVQSNGTRKHRPFIESHNFYMSNAVATSSSSRSPQYWLCYKLAAL